MGDGDVNFLRIKYKDYPNDIVWEPRTYIVKYYRADTKAYIRNKKERHLGILTTVPDDLQNGKAFLNQNAQWIPRENEQFAEIKDIPFDLRKRINDIGKRKASQQRKLNKIKQ